MIHVLLLLLLMDGLTLNIQLIIGVVNAKTNLEPSDLIGLKIKAITLVLNCWMESELLIGRNQDNILIIIIALLTEPYL